MTDREMALQVLDAIEDMSRPLSIVAGTYDAGWRMPDWMTGAAGFNAVMAACSEVMRTMGDNPAPGKSQ